MADYPANYGNLECKAHDENLAPFCKGSSPPAWCTQKWCYVDSSNCQGVVPYKSVLFANSDVYYSYNTCGESNEFKAWSGAATTGGTSASVTQLLDVVQSYLWSTRSRVQDIYEQLNSSEWCTVYGQCNCAECFQNDLWMEKTDFGRVGANARSQEFSCLAQSVAPTYSNVAAKEASPTERVGYQYFADQKSGSYLGWPAVQWCPEAEGVDPRFRPWYSSGSTGPKDLVLVVDVSGSMGSAGRAALAKAAAKAVIDTLEWKDFGTVILFNHGIAAQYSQQLVAMFDAERANLKNWLDQQAWAEGGTDFKVSLDRAFDVISASVSSGSTSMCQKAILFLTDGAASFESADYASVRQRTTQYSVALFTYALGSGADATVTKQLACENQGIFYPIPDGGDLANIMSRYYQYFAAGVEICTPSFTKYQDSVTRTELWPACLPAYDRTGLEPALLGVTCFDLNVMVNPSVLRSQSYWPDFLCKISDMTKQCRQLDINDCRLEKLRREYSEASSCITLDTSVTCPCADPACQDDPDFLDEKGYFCDTWVGDDCQRAASDWGYSATGEAQIQTKCKRSCGMCPQLNPCPKQTAQCSNVAQPSATACRATRTDKISPNSIEGTVEDVAGASASSAPVGPSCLIAATMVAVALG
ncbi:unnamed protein product [Effrenium voratum]|uniref:VWFA domain-containing protein n=1 Tax=Effrenium voratum TaxID=2562239 RepID=A0AA36I0Z7_9DINO|nr:unnamed protein product [Effrenium voratum]